MFDGSELGSVELGDVQAGWEQEGSDEDYMARQSVPALAVDPSAPGLWSFRPAIASPRSTFATTPDGTRFEIIDLEMGETVGRAAPRLETWLLYLD